MPEKTFNREKPRLSMGTIGHVSHGKTTLTTAITFYLAGKGLAEHKTLASIDTHKEEKIRGLTIKASRVEYETEHRHYTHIDCPGHVNGILNMFAGAAQMDAAILLVAAPDGVRPQTREHMLLARQAGVSKLVVFMNKIDLVKDTDYFEYTERTIREMLDHFQFDGRSTPIIHGSALKALQGEAESLAAIATLVKAIDEYIPTPVRAIDQPFLMPIHSVESVTGQGAIATGKIERGRILKGEEVEILGNGIEKVQATVISIVTFGKTVEEGMAGDHVRLLLRGVKEDALCRGMVISTPKSLDAHRRFHCEAYILPRDQGGRSSPFFNDYSPQFLFRMTAVTGQITLPSCLEMIMPGDTVTFEVALDSAVAIEVGLSFAMREGKQTIGTGKITQILP